MEPIFTQLTLVTKCLVMNPSLIYENLQNDSVTHTRSQTDGRTEVVSTQGVLFYFARKPKNQTHINETCCSRWGRSLVSAYILL